MYPYQFTQILACVTVKPQQYSKLSSAQYCVLSSDILNLTHQSVSIGHALRTLLTQPRGPNSSYKSQSRFFPPMFSFSPPFPTHSRAQATTGESPFLFVSLLFPDTHRHHSFHTHDWGCDRWPGS